MDLSKLTDSELYKLCQEYGSNAIIWRRRFAGLLPEVSRRGLYLRRGFGSIYEFAFKVSGLSQDSTDRILRISKKLEDKPLLKAQLETGSQSWSKIEKVAFVATPETDKDWAKKVETMPYRALEAYVNEIKTIDAGGLENIPQTPQYRSLTFTVSTETEERLRLAKQELEHKRKQPLTFNEVLKDLFVQKPEAQIAIEICPECAKRKADEARGRYIPAAVQKYVKAKYKNLCAFKNCHEPATSLHHTRRYALNQSHDPDYIVPLCKKHERLMHTGLIKNETDSPEHWKLLNAPDPKDPKFQIDQIVQKFRLR